MFALVTDSTCDIPRDLATERRIRIVPQHILFGTESLRDGEELDGATFYQRLQTSEVLPRTSQPTPVEFASAYKTTAQAAQTDKVLCITLSSKLSGTYESAQQAATTVDLQVTTVDSEFVSMGLGLQVLRAADMRDAGASVEEVVADLNLRRPNIRLYFTVATLDYLHKGGRIGRAKHLVGSALQIKPILDVAGGMIESKASVRTRGRALKQMEEIVKEDMQSRTIKNRPKYLAVMHGNAAEEADDMSRVLQETWQPENLLRGNVCSAVGVHAGPGVLGIAYDLTN